MSTDRVGELSITDHSVAPERQAKVRIILQFRDTDGGTREYVAAAVMSDLQVVGSPRDTLPVTVLQAGTIGLAGIMVIEE